ncbi:MAG: hypothetical protein WAV90_16485 [Gordonia amarae]
MSGDSLSLNIGGGAEDVTGVNTQHGVLESSAGDLLTNSNQLFDGALLGSGADSGGEFSQRLDSGLQGAREVVQGVNQAVHSTQDETVAFDRGGFSSNYS